jgi:hypothetical protein
MHITACRHWSLSWATWIQCTPAHRTSNIILPSKTSSCKWPLPFRFCDQSFVCITNQVMRATWPTSLSVLHLIITLRIIGKQYKLLWFWRWAPSGIARRVVSLEKTDVSGWRQFAPLKRRPTPTRLHGAISHKELIFILAAVKTWNLTY